ncbi:MAG: hypothetical protein ACLFPM_04190 [Candidatus Izemoplasmatales bacterium]
MFKKITIPLLLLMISLLLISCKESLPNKNYEDFPHIDHWNDTLNFSDETIVFYYSPYCEICQAIQDEATEYLVILEEKGYPVYMIHEGMIYEQGTPPRDIIETPSILVYKNKELDEMISGSKPILNYLSNKSEN